MQHQEFEVPEELRDSIKCIWYNIKDDGELPYSFEVQPDGYAEIIFYFGRLSRLSFDSGLQQLPSPFLMGLLNQPAVFQTGGRLEIIGIRCFPWTVFDLLGLQPGRDGVRVFEHPIAGLQGTLQQLIRAGQLPEALAEINRYFLKARLSAINKTLSKAGIAMGAARGTLPVSQVAAAAHATVRTLERKFKQAAGYSVKDVSGLMRFEQVRNHLWLNPDAGLAGLAYELGYADQAHLSREFKRYSGSTPAAFARKAKKGKMIVTNDFVAFVQA